MSAESRRAQRSDEQSTEKKPDKVVRRRRVWLIITLVVIALLLAVCWVGLRAITVKDGLTKSQELISDIQNGGDVDKALPELSENAASAGAAASDPVWWLMEWVPVVGDNLRGVRLAAQSLDALVNGVALPVIGD